MLVNFEIRPDGSMLVTVPGGGEEDFAQAREKIQAAFRKMNQTVPELVMVGEPEMHSHGPETTQVRKSLLAGDFRG
jgi:hypothetical protein